MIKKKLFKKEKMMKKPIITILLTFLAFPLIVMAASDNLVEIKAYSLDTLDNILTKLSVVELDEEISSDGKASLKINVKEPVMINLFKSGDIDVEDAKLVYQAKIKTQEFKGKVYLEMWCYFEKDGQLSRYFSRDLNTPITGDTEGWQLEQTPFFLKKDQNPVDVELNVVIQGTGTVWVDDVKLMRAPLPNIE